MLIICLLIVLGCVAVDQATKWIVALNMEIGQSVPFIKNVFHFTYIRNPGAAFGSLSNSRWIFIVLSTVMIAGMIYYLVKFRPKSKLMYIPMSMIIGGGLGNMIDRLFYGDKFGDGTVIDFLDFCAFPKLWSWIFNVADAFVVVGAIILFTYLLIDIIKDEKNKAASKQKTEE
jgi:signal peptidase II